MSTVVERAEPVRTESMRWKVLTAMSNSYEIQEASKLDTDEDALARIKQEIFKLLSESSPEAQLLQLERVKDLGGNLALQAGGWQEYVTQKMDELEAVLKEIGLTQEDLKTAHKHLTAGSIMLGSAAVLMKIPYLAPAAAALAAAGAGLMISGTTLMVEATQKMNRLLEEKKTIEADLQHWLGDMGVSIGEHSLQSTHTVQTMQDTADTMVRTRDNMETLTRLAAPPKFS